MSLTSGQVAEEAGVNKQTLRYYERRGLIEEPPRDRSNYRQYPPEVVPRISFIKRAQELGFTLGEIEKLLEMTDGRREETDELLSFAEEKLEDIREKLEQYRRLETVLSHLVQECREKDAFEPCPLVEALTEEEFNVHA